MPLRESICVSESCPFYGVPVEHYYPRFDTPPDACAQCGGPTWIIPSPFAVVWTGAIGQRYRDRDKEGYYKPDGMWQWTRNTPDGKPKPIRLETWSDVRRFSRENGCRDPREMPRNVEVTEDGKGVKNTRGMPGVEL